MLMVSNRSHAARSSDFEVTRPITPSLYSLDSITIINYIPLPLLFQLDNELASLLTYLTQEEKNAANLLSSSTASIIRGYFFLIISGALAFF